MELDRHITTFHHGNPRRFWTALALEFVARSLIMVEYVLILTSVGVAVSYAEAYAIGTITGMVGMALFIIPFEMGTKEGAFYGVFQVMGIDPHLGVYTAIINRIWEVCWIAVGLALIWLQGGARQVAAVVEKAQHVVQTKPEGTEQGSHSRLSGALRRGLAEDAFEELVTPADPVAEAAAVESIGEFLAGGRAGTC